MLGVTKTEKFGYSKKSLYICGMEDVEKICEMQRTIDEYERFSAELYLMLSNKDIKRQFVSFNSHKLPFSEAILKEVKKLIELCSTKEK